MREGSRSGDSIAAGADAADTTGADEDEVFARQRQARAALPLVRQARSVWGEAEFDKVKTISGNSALINAVDKIKKDPALVAYKVQANSYKFSWALIPLSVPFVWLLFFWRRDLGLYDHTVFVTYSIAAMTLLAVAVLVLTKVGVPVELMILAFVILAPTHIFVHLRGSYQMSKRVTTVRFLFLSSFIWQVVGLFAVILLALGAVG